MFNRIVRALTNQELESLQAAVYSEQCARSEKRMNDGEFPILDSNEIALIKDGLKINAIKTYRDRTHVNLHLAKMVVENTWDEMINAGHRKQNPT